MKLTQQIEKEYASITPERIAEIKTYSVPKEMPHALDIFLNNFCPKNSTFNNQTANFEYEISLAMIQVLSFNYTSENITSFSLALSSFEEHRYFYRTGIFLSALINVHQEKTKATQPYVLFTNYLNKKIAHLCMNNKSIIQIIGDCGISCGFQMESGTIIVEGSTESRVGEHMCNGEIHVKKNTAEIRGQNHFYGGKIIVYGDKPIVDIWGFIRMGIGSAGEIYHKDTKIYPEEKVQE